MASLGSGLVVGFEEQWITVVRDNYSELSIKWRALIVHDASKELLATDSDFNTQRSIPGVNLTALTQKTAVFSMHAKLVS